MSEIEPQYRQYLNYMSLKTIFMTTTIYTIIVNIVLLIMIVLNHAEIGSVLWLGMQVYVFSLNYISNIFLGLEPDSYPTSVQKCLVIYNVFTVIVHTFIGICLVGIGKIPFLTDADMLSRVAIVFLLYNIIRITIMSCVIRLNPVSILSWIKPANPDIKWDYEIHQVDEHLRNFLDDESCCICSDNYEQATLVAQLPCDHYYHHTCIKKWLAINNTCPICREIIKYKNNLIEII